MTTSTTQLEPMRVLLADDEAKVRSALRLLVEQQPDMVVAGEASTAGELVASVLKSCPDAILLDWELPGRPMPGLLRVLSTICPGVRVIVMSVQPEASYWAGGEVIDAFVSKGDAPEHLLAVLGTLNRRNANRACRQNKVSVGLRVDVLG